MYQKDFDGWSSEKQDLHYQGQRPFYNEREIWWCALGINIGAEQDGTGINLDRPVVIIHGFNLQVCFVVALTGKKKEGKYYMYLGEIANREATAVLSQVRLVDSKRLVRKIGTLEAQKFNELKSALKEALFG